MLNIALVAGSSRNNSQSGKVARAMRQRLIELGHTSHESSSVIDLGLAPLPLWPAEDTGPWDLYRQQLAAADALVIIAPEWNGMACPAIKNFFIYASKAELAHKPGLLVGVSSGIGGAYPIAELRASSYKNCRLCYLPEHLIVRQVEKVLNGPQAADEADERIRGRIDYALDVLVRYGHALQPVREAISFDNPAFANGM
ncbi:NADPH-dependent FMN reductase [Pseudomonas sp. THAF187a]|jgi:NAD(P)H-dependent FMN reductase|uniref:NADPH-dependent FMN reductase n=1 Tax=Ectopseudomonas oleovorans TaxID=301 RepID=A0A653AXN4_ECTOL|nr:MULTISPECIES: NAD(P)H-dependent oxidoreductase [unclassified Pseudomonas]QFT22638.1 NADPH-dependent FMN reductase [Pseudomonas sp. THAF187a]QFT42825.1 NADPH-dependent FMN reductase [Pseudomonas sp. THAF42]CAE6932512.1 NADPH-dependent FMN reductase [Pseudomonas oleovorans]HIQ43859.1 NADPH-dependent oxidoreductase [Pseudomonas oleovorans]